jgi:hypothetical protein
MTSQYHALDAKPSEARTWLTLNRMSELQSQQGCYKGEKNLLHPAGNKPKLWIFILLGLVVSYQHFGTTYWSHLQGSGSPRTKNWSA